jgi:Zn-dependent peptidase ImmA (M78 family)
MRRDRFELNYFAQQLRENNGEDDKSFVDVFGIINRLPNTTLVFYPLSNRISGMCIKVTNIDSMIVVNSTHSHGRQRFTAAHELYHLNFQEKFTNVICSKDLIGVKDDEEINADDFASYFLAPMGSFNNYVKSVIPQAGKLTLNNIIEIEQNFQMSRQSTLIRLLRENFIQNQDYEEFKEGVISSAKTLGYSDHLYRPTPEEEQYSTSGAYITMVEDLKARGRISVGKYNELLLAAFRADIVYNLGGQEVIND